MEYPNLVFKSKEIVISNEDAIQIAQIIYKCSPPSSSLTDKDRAFLQRTIIIVAEKSLLTAAVFDLYAIFSSKAPSKSLNLILRKILEKSAKRWIDHKLNPNPRVNEVGIAGFLYYSGMAMEWRVRVKTGEPDMITSYLIF